MDVPFKSRANNSVNYLVQESNYNLEFSKCVDSSSKRLSAEPNSPTSSSIKSIIYLENTKVSELNKEYDAAMKLIAELQELTKEEDSINSELRQQINMLAMTQF